jgi:TnpA family transposase
MIPPHGEAPHVIDGLLYHEADLEPLVHHTDGGGVSEHVFGLMHLLGFRFAPRIPNLAEHKLYAFGKADTWPVLAPFIAGKINEEHIEPHWDNLLRMTASVRTGVISASLMLQRLGAYPRQNGLALALREVGRVQRTLLVLDWLDDPLLRRRTTAELNKGEGRNGLTRAVSFHRLGRVRDRSADARQHRAGGLTLVTAAIVLWNTVYLGRALDALRRDGVEVPDAFLGHLAPLGWRHINLTGDYHWASRTVLEPDGFRTLRPRPPALAAA